VDFINNLKAERTGKAIDVKLLEGELPDDVCNLLNNCNSFKSVLENISANGFKYKTFLKCFRCSFVQNKTKLLSCDG